MKALTAVLILSMLFLAFFVFKFIQHGKRFNKVYESFTIKPDPERITTQVLQEYGFRIHDTKSKLYAVHSGGISMEYIEGTEWSVLVIELGIRVQSTVHYMHDLIEWCEFHKNPIQKQEDKK